MKGNKRHGTKLLWAINRSRKRNQHKIYHESHKYEFGFKFYAGSLDFYFFFSYYSLFQSMHVKCYFVSAKTILLFASKTFKKIYTKTKSKGREKMVVKRKTTQKKIGEMVRIERNRQKKKDNKSCQPITLRLIFQF